MRLFVTGTGTGVGKTVVTSLIAYQWQRQKGPIAVAKPILSGFEPDGDELSDAQVLLRAIRSPATPDTIADISPWTFRAALSPDMAAAREGRSVPFEAVVQHCKGLPEPCLVEGVGGVMVPLDERRTVLDWIADTGMPALVVGGSYLGTLSHTLTAVKALHQRGVEVHGVVVSESEQQPVELAETKATLTRFLPDTRIIGLARLADPLAFDTAPDLLKPLGLCHE